MPFLSLDELNDDPLIKVETRIRWNRFKCDLLDQHDPGIQLFFAVGKFAELLDKKRPTPSDVNFAYLLNRQIIAVLAPNANLPDDDRDYYQIFVDNETPLRALTQQYPPSWKDIDSHYFKAAFIFLAFAAVFIGFGHKTSSDGALVAMIVISCVLGIPSAGFMAYSGVRHCRQACAISRALREGVEVKSEGIAQPAPAPFSITDLPQHHRPVHSQPLLVRESEFKTARPQLRTETDCSVHVEMQQSQPITTPTNNRN